jgi:catechol 2,3-dioxygenase-like lactoylglutathione lyase family enzyme
MEPSMRMSATVLGSKDPRSLARFYEKLLGWDLIADEPHWAQVKPPDGGTGLSFQIESDHVPPVWPAEPGSQQMMMHLDIAVDDLPEAVEKAQNLGAELADFQPQSDVRVMKDPAGHVFCLFESTHGTPTP